MVTSISKYKLALFFSIFSVFLFVSAKGADAATITLIPDKRVLKIGEETNIDVKIDTGDVSVNAGQATIQFQNSILEVTKIDKSNSVFSFWIDEPSFSNDNGTVKFIGGTPRGVVGKSLQVLRFTVKAKNSGTAEITLSDAAVTASDGQGTNVLEQTIGTTILTGNEVILPPPPIVAPLVGGSKAPPPPPIILPKKVERVAIPSKNKPALPVVKVPLYPDSTEWYNYVGEAIALWDVPDDVAKIFTKLDQNPSSVPTTEEKELDNGKNFGVIKEGTWYIHVQFKNNIGLGPVAHYKIAVDTTPPANFSIIFPNGEPTDNPAPLASYNSADSLSGIGRYEIRVDNTDSTNTLSNTFTLPLQLPGIHKLTVNAFDNAGNAAQNVVNFEIISIEPPVITAVSKKVFTGEGGLVVSGNAKPQFKVLITLEDQAGNTLFTGTVTPDEKGNWNTNIDTPLKKQAYQVFASTEDERGAISTPVKSGLINVKDRPLLVIDGIDITPTLFFILFVIIILAAFGIGWLSIRFTAGERNVDVVMANRDIENVFNLFKKDINLMLSKFNENKLNATSAMEVKNLLEKTSDRVEKMKEYVKQDVQDINKEEVRFFPNLFRKIKKILHIK